MTDTTRHPYSERRPTALERAAERYRVAREAQSAAIAALRDTQGGARERNALHNARAIADTEESAAEFALLRVAAGGER